MVNASIKGRENKRALPATYNRALRELQGLGIQSVSRCRKARKPRGAGSSGLRCGFPGLVGQEPETACLLLDHFQEPVTFVPQVGGNLHFLVAKAFAQEFNFAL